MQFRSVVRCASKVTGIRTSHFQGRFSNYVANTFPTALLKSARWHSFSRGENTSLQIPAPANSAANIMGMPSYERTARAGITGATEHQRDLLCFALHQRGWSLRKIGAHPKVAMSHVSVKHAIERVAGIPRVRTRPTRCSSCGEAWPVAELTGGVCPFCASSA
jgi:hypothetical protein